MIGKLFVRSSGHFDSKSCDHLAVAFMRWPPTGTLVAEVCLDCVTNVRGPGIWVSNAELVKHGVTRSELEMYDEKKLLEESSKPCLLHGFDTNPYDHQDTNGVPMPEDLTPIQAGELTIEPGPAKLSAPTVKGQMDVYAMERWAHLISGSSFVPDHLRWAKDSQRTLHNVFLVVNQAVAWGVNPMAVAAESYVVNGKLAYSGKLIAAVINASNLLEDELDHSFGGEGNSLYCTVTGKKKGKKKLLETTLELAKVRTKNEMWFKQPKQKLLYTTTLAWAREHMPNLVCGVYAIEDFDAPTLPITPIEVSANGTGEDEVIEAPTPEKLAQALPPDEERRETLQEAMASEMTAAPAAPVATGFAKKPTGIQAQARAEADLLFTARGLGRTPDDMHKRETIENSWLGKHGAKSWAHLSDEGAAEILKMIREKMAAPGAAPQATNEKK